MAFSLKELAVPFRNILTECLRNGTFPQKWKEAKLILLPKPDKLEGTPSAYRPICLLDDAEKILERIIGNRIVQHLSRGTGPNISPDQYEFHVSRSTVDAILSVRGYTDSVVNNTLSWEVIQRALKYYRVLGYLQKIIE